MHCHRLIANGSATHAITPVHQFVQHRSAGPVVLNRVDPIFATAALAAATLWNTYLPLRVENQQAFNISAATLPGNVVGEIWIPCEKYCNVTIDPSYNAYTNVLLHEIGHGIGLPTGSISTKYPQLKVSDPGNHWEPGDIDPREIMTATLDPNPYLSKYTLDAMSPHNHIGCYYDYQCDYGECIGHSSYAPGKCSDALVYDSAVFSLWVIFFILAIIFLIGFTFTLFDSSPQPKYDAFGTL